MHIMIKSVAIPFILAVQALSHIITVNTTSGRLSGVQADGVAFFKGIRFANPPTGDLRWEPPVAFVSSDAQNATSFGPTCVQQIEFQGQALIEQVDYTPIEDEDCLFLNVWTPAPFSGPLKPVIVWFYGGANAFGTSSLPPYDGTSFAKHQDVILVSFNYRTNVFGFPTAPELPASGSNLGLLDQELALAWVQDNIAQFGGDKCEVTIMGQSAGSLDVSLAINRRNSSESPPFRAGIMLSGYHVSTFPKRDFSDFNAFATAVGCTQAPGSSRLQCLRNVSASTIRAYTNMPNSSSFNPKVDNVTMFDDPLQRIRTGQIARVPILLGSMEDDGTVFAYMAQRNLSTTVALLLAPSGGHLSTTVVRELYPGLSDPQIIDAVWRDIKFRCPAKLWSDAFVLSGIKSVHRYTYGAVFADLQSFPNAGARHASELPILFGTFNRSTATAAEAELSHTFQKVVANFVKDPMTASPAPNLNWPAYEPELPGVTVAPTLAKIAYHGNVHMVDFIVLVQPNSTDAPCAVWDQFLDFRP